MPVKKCIHGKREYHCIDCKGAGICEHDKRKTHCIECKGVSICEHSRLKYSCKDCKGKGVCEHNKLKHCCVTCKGTSICIHDKNKYTCKECKGGGICEHNRMKYNCKECKGGGICEHDKLKRLCTMCSGTAYCEHHKRRTRCKECGGSELCKTPGCEKVKYHKKYKGYCVRCFIHQYPDEPNARNYKTKERTVVEFLQTTFPHFTLINDKRVADGCSRRRPDVLIDFGDQVICIEIDENMHESYDCSCENKRLMEISQDIGHRPLVFIRFNPDSYLNEKGKVIRSPWSINKSGICVVKHNTAWEHRLVTLQEQVNYWYEHRTSKTVEVIELFYDMNIGEVVTYDDGAAMGGAGV